MFFDCHKDILDSRWKYVSIIALPLTAIDLKHKCNQENFVICDNCRQYIICNDENDIRSWMEKFFAQESCVEDNRKIIDFCYANLYSRILGSLKYSRLS